MTHAKRALRCAFLLGLVALTSACLVPEPREGYYDHGQNRYYRDHTWHGCAERDEHCR
jgi:hypothetical protein